MSSASSSLEVDLSNCNLKDNGFFNAHVVNRKLPLSERLHVAEDSNHNYQRIDFFLTKLESLDSTLVETKDVRLCTGVINSFLEMKYILSVSQKSRIVNTFMFLILNKTMSIDAKMKLLDVVLEFTRGKNYNLVINKIPWEPFWNEMILVIEREIKLEQSASDGNLNYVKKLKEFLYFSRRYLFLEAGSETFAPGCFDYLINSIETNLSDLNSIRCLQGALQAVMLLPDNFPDYDKYLPGWVQTWTSIPKNIVWDFWWLKIFCKARKFSVSFDWLSIHDLLLAKVLEYSNDLDVAPHSNFPRGVPMYYRTLCPLSSNDAAFDIKIRIIQKIGKLMYFISLRENLATSNLASSSSVVTEYPPISCTPLQYPTVITAVSGETMLMDSCPKIIGYNTPLRTAKMNKTFYSICRFLETNRHLFSASNKANSPHIAYFLTFLVGQILRHKTFLFAENLNSAMNNFTYSLANLDDKLTYNRSGIVFKQHSYNEVSNNFFIGFCSGLLMEMLFGRSAVVSNIAMNAIRHVCMVDNSLVHLFMPHMLAALDVNSVSLSHLLIPSLSVIETLVRNLMYPDMSIMIKYIPHLLRLLVPGIDPSDSAKTRKVSSLLDVIFTQFTIRDNYTDVIHTFRRTLSKDFKGYSDENSDTRYYFEIMKRHKDLFYSKNDFYEVGDKLDLYYRNLSDYWVEFLSTLFDRIVLLFQSFEPPISNEDTTVPAGTQKYSNAQYAQMDMLNELFTSLFESIDISSNTTIFNAIEGKIIDFVVRCSIFKASKLIASMVCNLVRCNPNTLNKILQALIDKDLLDQTMPREKISFRLQIIGAACRMAGSKHLLSMDICNLLSSFFDVSFTENKEKIIRKATVKLIKDCFRGMMSFYPVSTRICAFISVSGTSIAGILGHPLNNRMLQNSISQDSFWNEPDRESVQYAVQKYKELVDRCIDKIANITNLTAINSSLIDQLSFNMILLTKLLISASDILGDDFNTLSGSQINTGNNLNLEETASSSDIESLENLNDYSTYVPHSGREDLLYSTDSEVSLEISCRNYIINLRKNVFNLLLGMMKNFYSSSTSNALAISSNSSTTSTSSVFYNNQIIMLLWLRLFNNISTSRNCFKANNSSGSNMFCFKELMIKEAIYKVRYNDKLDQTMRDRFLDYCYSYNLPMRKFQNSVERVHRLRVSKFSVATCRYFALNYKFEQNQPKLEQAELICRLYFIVSFLCGHEYDQIRNDAISIYSHLSSKFSPLLNDVIYDVINVVNGRKDRRLIKSSLIDCQNSDASSSDYNYSLYSGCMSILQTASIMSRICTNWNITIAFLESLVSFDQIENKITDNEKKLKLSVNFMDTVTNYLRSWRQNPLNCNQSPSNLFSRIFERLFVGYNTLVSSSSSSMAVSLESTSAAISVSSSVYASQNLGIRQSSLLMYILLHFTGHCDIEFNTDFFRCVIFSINQGQILPSQSIALSIFFRLIYRIYKKDAVNLFLKHGNSGVFDTVLGPRPLTHIISQESIQFLRDYFINGSYSSISMDYSLSESEGRKFAWTALFNAIMHTKDTSDDESDKKVNALLSSKKRWSHGVDSLLSSTYGLHLILNRKDYFPLSLTDKNIFSHWIDTENSVLIESLICSNLLFDGPFLDINIFKDIFEVLNNLGSSSTLNQAEQRAFSCTKAEVFAGFYRSYRKLRFNDRKNRPNSDFHWDEYGRILHSFFESNLKKSSKEYGQDWMGAIYFALSDNISFYDDNEHDSELVRNIINDFSWIYESSGVTDRTTEENITQLSQSIKLMDAVFYADLSQYRIKLNYQYLDKIKDSSGQIINVDRSYNSSIFDNLCTMLPLVSIETILSPFSPIRDNLSNYFSMISTVVLSIAPQHVPQLDKLVDKIYFHFKTLKEELNVTLLEAATADDITTNTKLVQSKLKYLYQLCITWMVNLSMVFTYSDICSDSNYSFLLKLFELSLEGCGCHEIEISKRCIHSCSLFVKSFSQGRFPLTPTMLENIVLILERMSFSPSYQTRLACMKCIQTIFVNHNHILSLPSQIDSKTKCKTLALDRLVNDSKLEVQLAARTSMISFLTHKSFEEMAKLAKSYTNNCDSLTQLEIKRRKINKDKGNTTTSTSLTSSLPTSSASINRNMEKDVAEYVKNLLMASCVILRYPYDVPEFIPSLLSAFIKHTAIDSVILDQVKDTIKEFKTSHNDRWKDYVAMFSRDLLDDFEGSGSSHYFA